MVEGEFAPSDECWFRILLESYRTSAGTLHHSAFRGQFRTSSQRPWSHELSGRLVSAAGSAGEILKQAEDFAIRIQQGFLDKGKPVPSKMRLAGWMCAQVREVRVEFASGVKIDAAFTPNDADRAHADLVVLGATTDDDIEPVRVHLLRILRVVTAENVKLLVSSCGRGQQ